MTGAGRAGRRANYGTHLFFALLFAAGGVAAILAGQGSTGGTRDTLLGIAGGLLCFLVAYGLVRRAEPPRLRGLALNVSPAEAGRGDELSVRVELTRAARSPLQVGLVARSVARETYRDQRGNPQTRERQRVVYEEWRDLPAAAALPPVRFTVPEDAPASVVSDNHRVLWAVAARKPGRLRFDRRLEQPVTVRGD